MITLHIARYGQNEGLSMLAESPQKFHTFNPYNTFFKPTDEEIKIVKELWNEAGEIYSSGDCRTYFVPQHLILLMAMMVNRRGLNNKISYPECGVLAGVQSIYFIFSMLLHKKYGGDLYFFTLSEYMVRCSQLMVLEKLIIPDEEIIIFDDANSGEGFTVDTITNTILGAHDYEQSVFSISMG